MTASRRIVPAVPVREILVRRSPLRGSRRLAPLVVCACLAFKACFEFIEWPPLRSRYTRV